MSSNIVRLSDIIIRNPEVYTVMGGGVRLLRLRIREGSRFTIMDLDSVTAARGGKQMVDWATEQSDQ